MNRKVFLESHWTAYPSLSSKEGFFCGRVTELNEDDITITGQEETQSLETKDLGEGSHPDLGASLSPFLLNKGDVVAYDQATKALFLLSPNLENYTGRVKKEKAKRWDSFLKKTQSFLESRGLQSIQTPLLVESPGVDHHINFLKVQASQTQRTWCLPTSPEIHLKKALCEGWEQIYEIKSCFRDDLPGPLHQTEFTMLEWYRSYWSLEDLAEETFEFIDHMVGKEQKKRSLSVSMAFKEYLGLELSAETHRETLMQWNEKLGIDHSQSDDWNDLFFRIFMEKIEPQLGQGEITRLYDFPASQASLAQINKEGWAERFEIYWQGVELANAYKEVNDPKENQRRFDSENQKRRGKEVEPSPMDSQFLKILEQGMPPASGIAFGLSRFFHQIQGAGVIET